MCTANATTMADAIEVLVHDDFTAAICGVLNISPSQKKEQYTVNDDWGDGFISKPNAPKKRNNLFFINAFREKESTAKRSQEEEQRRQEYETFKKDIEKLAGDFEFHSEYVGVDNYSDMKMEFKKYLKETPKNHTPANIVVVFLGHGSFEEVTGKAKLCFEDPESPYVNKALNEMHDIHKNSNIKSSLKIVFSECYSHEHSIETKGDAKRGEFCKPSGYSTKFMYLSSDTKPETDSSLRLISQPKSPSLNIIGNDLFVDNWIPSDESGFFQLKCQNLKEYIEKEFNVKLNDNQTRDLFIKEKECEPTTSHYEIIGRNLDKIKEKIAQLKKEIKHYKHFKIKYPCSDQANKQVNKHLLSANGYPFDSVDVISYDHLENLMSEFIKNQSSLIQIIFISGYCRKVNNSAEKHKMVFNNEDKSMEDILKIVKSSPYVRVTFFVEDFAEDIGDGATSTSANVSIYSESVAKLEFAKHVELDIFKENIAEGLVHRRKNKRKCQIL